jgi:hypothetical protein
VQVQADGFGPKSIFGLFLFFPEKKLLAFVCIIVLVKKLND